jgi:DNA mismatch repair protein MSH6
MAPPKTPNDAKGMRSISSFFAPRTNTPKTSAAPESAKPKPDAATSDSPDENRDDRDDEPRAAKAAKLDATTAPGAVARKETDERAEEEKDEPPLATSTPDAPSTATAAVAEKRAAIVESEPSPPSAMDEEEEEDDDVKDGRADVGRRIAVFWKKEKRFYAGKVAAFDAKRKKHRVLYDDGDDEWIAIQKRRVKWDEAAAAEAKGGDDDDDDDDGDESDTAAAASDDDDDDDDDALGAEEGKRRGGRVTARRAAAAAALKKVGGGGKGGGEASRPSRASAKRKVVLSDSDVDFDGGEGDGDDGGDDEESDFDVEEEESDDDDDDASDDDASESESYGAEAKKKRAPPPAKKKTSAASPAKRSTAAAPPPATLPPIDASSRNPNAAKSFAERMASATATATAATTTTTDGDGDGAPNAAAAALAGPAQYADRDRLQFPWLQPENRRDASGKRPNEPGYDKSTLLLPKDFPKCKDANGKPFTVSPGQAQWWRFKASHFDSVIMFKMGKFYELFEMDAHVGAADLGLMYMKGEQPHCGFPEKNYAANAERLARAGHRVVIVEQTETPAQLAERKAAGKTRDNVVMREKVAVLTRGTLVDPEMCEASPDAAYCVATFDGGAVATGEGAEDERWVGVCAADCATGRFLLGAWLDDAHLSGLRTALATLRPAEVVTTPGGPPPAIRRVLFYTLVPVRPRRRGERRSLRTFLSRRTVCFSPPTPRSQSRRTSTAFNFASDAFQLHPDIRRFARTLDPRRDAIRDAAPDAQTRSCGRDTCADDALEALRDGAYFPTLAGGASAPNAGATCGVKLPDVLATLATTAPARERAAGLGAFGVMHAYLSLAMLDRDLIPLGRVEALPGPGDAVAAAWSHGGYVAMDAAALSGLEVLEGADGGSRGSLLSSLDRCASGPGRRTLRRWVCRPLRSHLAVEERQRAVRCLRGVASDALRSAQGRMRKAPDLERAVSRLVGAAGGRGRDAANVILYEDAAKARLNGFLRALEGMRAARDIARDFDDVRAAIADANAPSLRALVTEGGGGDAPPDAIAAVAGAALPELTEALAHFERAFDWDGARASGRIEPKPGADAAVDAADARLAAADDALAEWLSDARKKIGGGKSEVAFVRANKDTHLVEVPDRLSSRVPAGWQREGKRKGFERFDSPELGTMRKERAAAEEAREDALGKVLSGLVLKFCEEWPRWQRAAEAIACLDALCSLALAAEDLAACCAQTCTPVLLPPPSTEDAKPSLSASRLTHPTVGAMSGGKAFVPNDTFLGGETPASPPFLLLTGPNMGGKSTLLRQVCLAAVMAHVGADVPAASFTMTAADAIYVRMGAKDNIVGGQSTFMVELSETAAMLRRATRNSLVALDELGRGTATTDGAAIAHAVVRHLVDLGARSLFSTHYHRLADDRAGDARVRLAHMGCEVSGDRGAERVTFLYALREGACPKSYGVNVARLAGLPESVLKLAAEKSAEMETERRGEGPSSPLPCAGLSDARVMELAKAALRARDDADAIAAVWRDARRAAGLPVPE